MPDRLNTVLAPARRFARSRDANVAMMFALTAPILLLAIAIGVDFTNAAVTRTRLNAAADAATLAALTPAMMAQSDSTAQAAAAAMFQAKVAALGQVSSAGVTPSIVITHPNNVAATRQVSITYTAQVKAIFSGVLNMTTLGVSGSSIAQASQAPNINFYLLLDNSPSMALPATTAGISQMQNLTPTQDNGNACAFACHQASTNNGDTQGNKCSDGSTPTLSGSVNGVTYPNQYCAATHNGVSIKQIDNFQLARNNSITLRLDELNNGVTTLMQTAASYQASLNAANPPVYKFGAYSMNTLWSIGTTNNQLMALTANYTSGWTTASANFGVMEMFANNTTCANSACTSGGSGGDVGTNFDVAMSSINSTMPAPGNGTNQSGDSPQEVLFFVTDGVEDEQLSGNRLIQAINANGATNYCTQIKNRGIQIAILYTEYLPTPLNGFYQGTVATFQSNIGPSLQACASPGLYYDAAVGTNLGAALVTLFDQVLAQNGALTH